MLNLVKESHSHKNEGLSAMENSDAGEIKKTDRNTVNSF